MHHDTTRDNEIVIVLVEDDPHQRAKMAKILTNTYPDCVIKTIANGTEAFNYLLNPVNKYDLVILDGKLDAYSTNLFTKINGPEIAEEMLSQNIDAYIVLFTNDPKMLEEFDERCGTRFPEIEKPCRESNVVAVLSPIITARNAAPELDMEESEEPSYFIPGAK